MIVHKHSRHPRTAHEKSRVRAQSPGLRLGFQRRVTMTLRL